MARQQFKDLFSLLRLTVPGWRPVTAGEAVFAPPPIPPLGATPLAMFAISAATGGCGRLQCFALVLHLAAAAELFVQHSQPLDAHGSPGPGPGSPATATRPPTLLFWLESAAAAPLAAQSPSPSPTAAAAVDMLRTRRRLPWQTAYSVFGSVGARVAKKAAPTPKRRHCNHHNLCCSGQQ